MGVAACPIALVCHLCHQVSSVLTSRQGGNFTRNSELRDCRNRFVAKRSTAWSYEHNDLYEVLAASAGCGGVPLLRSTWVVRRLWMLHRCWLATNTSHVLRLLLSFSTLGLVVKMTLYTVPNFSLLWLIVKMTLYTVQISPDYDSLWRWNYIRLCSTKFLLILYCSPRPKLRPGTFRKMSCRRVSSRRFYTFYLPGCLALDILRSVPQASATLANSVTLTCENVFTII
jgi:hypothetical protein